MLCTILGISRNAYYKRVNSKQKVEKQANEIVEHVRKIREALPRVGTRKLYHMLKNELQGIGRDKFFAILRQHGMLVRPRKKYARTTESNHYLRKHPNLVKNLLLTGPLQVVVSDLTYLTTTSGFIYLFLITDLFSRKIIGYSLCKTRRAEGAVVAAKMAFPTPSDAKNTIHHSDRGIQYCSAEYTEFLYDRGVRISMTEKDHVYENATAERVNGILKSEFYLDHIFSSFAEAKKAVSQTIYAYNTLRPHLMLNYETPEQVHAA